MVTRFSTYTACTRVSAIGGIWQPNSSLLSAFKPCALAQGLYPSRGRVAFFFLQRYILLIPEEVPFLILIKAGRSPGSICLSRMRKAETCVCYGRRQQETNWFAVLNLGMTKFSCCCWLLKETCSSEYRDERLKTWKSV